MGVPSLTHLKFIARRHFAERAHYAHSRDWLMSIYNRVLIHLPGVPLPGRHRIWAVRLPGTPQPLRLRLATSDWYSMEEAILGEEYAPLIRRNLTEVRQILDLGANVGMTVRLWQTLWPDARIVAVEPDPANLEMARSNALPSAHPPTFVHACVAGRSRVVHLDRSGDEYSFRMQDGEGSGERIEALTVPDVCARGKLDGMIDLLKCDVEGAEAEIFANCGDWIHRVRHLAVEVHAPYNAELLLSDLNRAGVQPDWTEIVDKGSVGVVFMRLADRNHRAEASDDRSA